MVDRVIKGSATPLNSFDADGILTTGDDGSQDEIQVNMDIKPCPFCGTEGELSESEPSTARFNEGAVHFAVQCFAFECMGVKANVWQSSPEDAIKIWNKRVPPK